MRKDIGDAEGRQGTAMSHTCFVPQSTGVCHDVCESTALLSSFASEHGNQLNTHS